MLCGGNEELAEGDTEFHSVYLPVKNIKKYLSMVPL